MALQTTVTIGGTPAGALDMVPVYLKKKLLEIAKKKLVFHQLGEKEDLPEGQGKTARWIRYDRIGLPLVPITEGVTPTTFRDPNISKVEATVDQWGDIHAITDVAELTIFHKAFQIMAERMGTQASETVDREIQRVLLGGTNTIFTDPAITDRTAIAAGSVMTTDVLQRVLASLRTLGAPDFSGDYVGVFDPSVEQDLLRDPTFQSAATYGAQTPLFNGEIGKWMGVRWMRSNFIPVIGPDSACDIGTDSSPAASGGETAITTAASWNVVIVGLDINGFETHIGPTSNIGFTAGDVLLFTLPALPSGVYAYNIYAAPTGTTPSLQAEAQAPGIYRIVGGSVAATGTAITYASGGLTAPVQPAAGVFVHQTYVMGRQAFGVLELTGIETMVTPNVASDSDPMKQRRKGSWKTMFKGVILNPNFFYRIESSSKYQTTFNPN
jgi:N4-gp56 family major capsid protein